MTKGNVVVLTTKDGFNGLHGTLMAIDTKSVSQRYCVSVAHPLFDTHPTLNWFAADEVALDEDGFSTEQLHERAFAQ